MVKATIRSLTPHDQSIQPQNSAEGARLMTGMFITSMREKINCIVYLAGSLIIVVASLRFSLVLLTKKKEDCHEREILGLLYLAFDSKTNLRF